MGLTFIGLLGLVGIVFMLLAYFLLIVGQLKVVDMHYIMLNLIGAFMVLFALFSGATIPVFQTLVGWMFISVYGFYKHHITTTT